MRKSIICIAFLFSLFLPNSAFSWQESVQTKIEKLRQQKEQVSSFEKEALKKEIGQINALLEEGKISKEEAELEKEKAAEKRAMNIQNRIGILDNQIALISRNKEDDGWENSGSDPEWEKSETRDISEKWDDRTKTHLVVAAGINNALEDGQSFDDSDFKEVGSRFFEIGVAWRTRVFKESGWLRFKYGFSFQFNGLKPENNQIFVEEGDLTLLKSFPFDLDKAKFRMDNLVIPVHFEFGPYKKIETEDALWFSTKNKFRVGIGGYAGVNIGERQKLKYEHREDDVKQKLLNDFNTNDFIYGISGYIGLDFVALYAKYDINTIFDDPNEDLHNISFGLRFDIK